MRHLEWIFYTGICINVGTITFVDFFISYIDYLQAQIAHTHILWRDGKHILV